MVSVCLPSDTLLQNLPSYLGFHYLGRGVSLHSCSSKAQPLLLTSDMGWLLSALCPRSGVAAERSYPTSEEWWLYRRRRAERSYSMFKVRRGDLIQGKEQQLRFAGAAMKRHPMSRVRETQVRP